MTDTRIADALLDTPGAGAYLGMPPDTLAYWRSMRTGPTFIRLGKHIRYRRADLDAYVQAQSVSH